MYYPMKKANNLNSIEFTNKDLLEIQKANKKNLMQTKKKTKKDLLNWIFSDDLIVNKNKNEKPMYDKILEKNLKANNEYSNVKTIVKTCNDTKKLGTLTLYKAKNPITFKSDLLKEYNKDLEKKDYLIKYSTIKTLEGLYNNLYKVLYNWDTKNDLFNIYKTYYTNTIGNDWLKNLDLKHKVQFEKSIDYFINAILDNKIVNPRIIKRDYIYKKYLQFLTYNTLENLEEQTTDGGLIENELQTIANYRYIIEKLNSTWKMQDLKNLLEMKETIIKEYKENRDLLKAWLIDKEKKILKKDYDKALSSVMHKIKNIKKDIKIDLYIE